MLNVCFILNKCMCITWTSTKKRKLHFDSDALNQIEITLLELFLFLLFFCLLQIVHPTMNFAFFICMIRCWCCCCCLGAFQSAHEIAQIYFVYYYNRQCTVLYCIALHCIASIWQIILSYQSTFMISRPFLGLGFWIEWIWTDVFEASKATVTTLNHHPFDLIINIFS